VHHKRSPFLSTGLLSGVKSCNNPSKEGEPDEVQRDAGLSDADGMFCRLQPEWPQPFFLIRC